MKRTLYLLIVVVLLAAPACALFSGAVFAPTGERPAATPFAATMAVPEIPEAPEDPGDPQVPAATAALPTVAAQPTATFPPLEVPGAPEVANYTIAVTLDPETRRLQGAQSLTYHNTAQEPIRDLVFHLYLNAFKNSDTIFMQESGGQLRGHEFIPENSGWIEVDALHLADGTALDLELLEDGTLARADLPQPVAPGQSLTVELAFTAQLPQIFARTGWVIDQRGDPFFLVAQWYPKLGVWSDEGWQAEPFHGNAEFFADFGDYQVSITLPAEYVTGATGTQAAAQRSGDGMQTITYRAAGVIDFAWVASPHLERASQMAGPVEINYLYLPEHDWSVRRILRVVSTALEQFSAWFGDYPYPQLTVVDVPEEGPGAGGMEYPTFITVGAMDDRDRRVGPTHWTNILEVIAVHEVAHQWWQSMVATNEAREPWLDEGFADYSTVRLFEEIYGLPFDEPDMERFQPSFLEGRRQSFLRNPQVPMYGTAWEFPNRDYVIATYAKPVMSFLTLERILGEETMTEILRTYFERYRFGHPTTADFQEVAVAVSGEELDWFFEGLVYGDDTINYVAQSIDGDEFTVERQGEIALPAEVLVTFQRGASETVLCPAEEAASEPALCTHSFPGRTIRSIEVDPERKLIIDLDWTDNELTR